MNKKLLWIVFIALFLSGCSNGVNQEEFSKLEKQYEAQKEEFEEYRLKSAKKIINLKKLLDEKKRVVDKYLKEKDDLREKLKPYLEKEEKQKVEAQISKNLDTYSDEISLNAISSNVKKYLDRKVKFSGIVGDGGIEKNYYFFIIEDHKSNPNPENTFVIYIDKNDEIITPNHWENITVYGVVKDIGEVNYMGSTHLRPIILVDKIKVN